MIGVLTGLAVYIVALGHWHAAFANIAMAGIAIRWVGRQALIPAAAALLAAWWISSAVPPPLPRDVPMEQGWRLEITSMPQMREQGWSFTATILDGPGEGFALLVYTSDSERIVTGDRIYTYGTVTRREAITDSFGTYLDGRGVSGQLYTGEITVDQSGTGVLSFINRARQETIARLTQAVPGDAGALLAGFVTGDDGQLSERSDESFRNAGLSHLTAVSGANLGMVVAMVLAVGRVAGRRRSSWLVAGAGAAWMYALFVGLSPPTLRAALLTTGLAGGRLAGRPIDMLTLAFSTAALQLLVRPIDAYSISFHLSTAASIGLAAGLNGYPPVGRRVRLSDLLVVTAFAQLATLPIIAATFGDVPLMAVLANVVAVPLASFAFTIAMAGSAAAWISTSLAEALLIPAAWAADGVLGVANLYGQPWGVLSVGEFGPPGLAMGLIVAFLVLLYAGGELARVGRQLRVIRGKIGPGG